MMPASASAPVITANSIGSEPDWVCRAESAAVTGAAATVADGAATAFEGWLAANWASSGDGLVAGLAAGRSGQREATTDACGSGHAGAVVWVFAVGGVFWATVTGAADAARTGASS